MFTFHFVRILCGNRVNLGYNRGAMMGRDGRTRVWKFKPFCSFFRREKVLVTFEAANNSRACGWKIVSCGFGMFSGMEYVWPWRPMHLEFHSKLSLWNWSLGIANWQDAIRAGFSNTLAHFDVESSVPAVLLAICVRHWVGNVYVWESVEFKEDPFLKTWLEIFHLCGSAGDKDVFMTLLTSSVLHFKL